MPEQETIWYLCVACAQGLKSSLDLKAKKEQLSKGECRMCRKKVYGSNYVVKYKTKGA